MGRLITENPSLEGCVGARMLQWAIAAGAARRASLRAVQGLEGAIDRVLHSPTPTRDAVKAHLPEDAESALGDGAESALGDGAESAFGDGEGPVRRRRRRKRAKQKK